MKNKYSNFVLNKTQKVMRSLKRTNEEGGTLRRTRLRKFGKRGRTLALLAQIAAIWYLSFAMVSYLTTDTGAYFNDVETISETISAAPDFCEGLNGSSDYWHQYCKDNAGIGNGPEPVDEDTGEGTDPDNPGHNKDGCDDHTSAPCSEDKRVTNFKAISTSNSVMLTWSNPTENKFKSINIYRNEDPTPVGTNITNGEFEDSGLDPSTIYIYRLKIIDNSGKEKTEQTFEVTTEAVITEEPKDDTSESVETKSDNEPPAEVSGIKIERNDANVTLLWINPSDPDFAYVRVYIDGNLSQANDKLTDQSVNYKKPENKEVIFKITTIDTSGNESAGEIVTIN